MAKILFSSGTAVTARWLNASQFLGPGNPGVVFVANPTEDFQYPLLTPSSVDITQFNINWVPANGNSTIGGLKNFSTIPTFPTAGPLSPAGSAANKDYVDNSIASAIAGAGYVDLASNQNITGIKTFTDARVSLTPPFSDSAVSRQYVSQSYVDLTSAQGINGTKTFADIKVPVPTDPDDASRKDWTEAQILPVQTSLTALQNTVATLDTTVLADIANLAGLVAKLNGGVNAATNTGWFSMPNNLRILYCSDAGTTAQNEPILFPTLGQGFPGFSGNPMVLATSLGVSQNEFTPSVSNVTSAGFQKRMENFGGGPGTPISYLAIGF